MRPKIPARVDAGNPKNWPRQIARKHPCTLDATSKLLGETDEMNMRFAVTEFVLERETAERARLQKELLAWAERNKYILFSRGAEGSWLSLEEFQAGLERICAAKKKEG